MDEYKNDSHFFKNTSQSVHRVKKKYKKSKAVFSFCVSECPILFCIHTSLLYNCKYEIIKSVKNAFEINLAGRLRDDNFVVLRRSKFKTIEKTTGNKRRATREFEKIARAKVGGKEYQRRENKKKDGSECAK